MLWTVAPLPMNPEPEALPGSSPILTFSTLYPAVEEFEMLLLVTSSAC